MVGALRAVLVGAGWLGKPLARFESLLMHRGAHGASLTSGDARASLGRLSDVRRALRRLGES